MNSPAFLQVLKRDAVFWQLISPFYHLLKLTIHHLHYCEEVITANYQVTANCKLLQQIHFFFFKYLATSSKQIMSVHFQVISSAEKEKHLKCPLKSKMLERKWIC